MKPVMRPRSFILAILICLSVTLLTSGIWFDDEWQRHREVDLSLYFDVDPANDPNFCDRAGVNCNRPEDWLAGWHIERCLHGLSYDYRIGECIDHVCPGDYCHHEGANCGPGGSNVAPTASPSPMVTALPEPEPVTMVSIPPTASPSPMVTALPTSRPEPTDEPEIDCDINHMSTPEPEPVTMVSIPPTSIPPTSIPPTSIPPTSIPPTSIPPTSIPPTSIPPANVCGEGAMVEYVSDGRVNCMYPDRPGVAVQKRIDKDRPCHAEETASDGCIPRATATIPRATATMTMPIGGND